MRREWAAEFFDRKDYQGNKVMDNHANFVLLSRDETLFHRGTYKWKSVMAVPEKITSNISLIAFHFVIQVQKSFCNYLFLCDGQIFIQAEKT